jgi:hypothetical protein
MPSRDWHKIRVFRNFIPGKLIVQSFLAGPGGFALVEPDCNFCQLTLFWPHVLKMEILIAGFAATACCAGDLTIAWHGSMATPTRLIIAALVASIMMVVFTAGAWGFVVVVSTCFIDLIVRVLAALLVRMPNVITMHLAGLKTLVLARGGTLLLARILVASLAVATPIVLSLKRSIGTLRNLLDLQWSAKWQSLRL